LQCGPKTSEFHIYVIITLAITVIELLENGDMERMKLEKEAGTCYQSPVDVSKKGRIDGQNLPLVSLLQQ